MVICSSSTRVGAYVYRLRISTPSLGLAAPDLVIMLHGLSLTGFARADLGTSISGGRHLPAHLPVLKTEPQVGLVRALSLIIS